MYKVTKPLPTILALLLIAACPGRPKTKEDFFKAGTLRLEAQDPGAAVIFFKNALEKDPNYADARFALARAYLAAGKHGAAEKELQRVLLQKPKAPEVRVELARAWSLGGKPDEALKALAGTSGNGNERDVFEISGWARAQRGEHEAAVAELRKALTIQFRADTALMLSRVYLHMGKPGEARELLAKLLETKESKTDALLLLAEAFIFEKDAAGALDIYDQLINDNPRDLRAPVGKARLLAQLRRFEETLDLAEEIIRKSPGLQQGYALKGLSLLYLKKYSDAVNAFQKTVSLGRNARTCYLLGLSHFYANEHEQAMSQTERALALDPSFAQARVILSLIYLKQNKTSDAIAEIRKVLAAHGKNALAHSILGSAYLLQGRHREGLAELDRALEIDPSLADVRIRKAAFQLAQGNTGAAEAELGEALRTDPEILHSRVLLASYYVKRNENSKAIDIAQEGLRNGKGDAALYSVMADAFIGQRDLEKAERALEKAMQADPGYAEAYFKMAALRRLSGEEEKAVALARTFALRSPGNARSQLFAAFLLERAGDTRDAGEFFERARKTGSAEGAVETAKYHFRAGRPGAASDILEKTARKHPMDPRIHELKGQLLAEQKKYEGALQAFEDLARIDPQSGLRALINTHLAMGQPEKALERVRQEITRRPERADIRAELSRIYVQMNRHLEAVENARLVIQRDPEAAAGHMALAAVHVSANESDKAIEVLTKASHVGDAGMAIMLGNLHAARKDYPAALAQYQKAERLQPGNVNAVFRKAVTLQLADRRKEAISGYEDVLKLRPDHAAALNNLAYLHGEEGESPSRALQYAIQAYLRAPDSGAVQDTLGYVLLKNGNIEPALKALKQAEAGMPDDPSVAYHLALAFKEKKDPERYAAYLRKAAQAGDFPESRRVKKLLAELRGAARDE